MIMNISFRGVNNSEKMNKYYQDLSDIGIFPSALRSLWNPITPSSQTKICLMSDSPAINIYY